MSEDKKPTIKIKSIECVGDDIHLESCQGSFVLKNANIEKYDRTYESGGSLIVEKPEMTYERIKVMKISYKNKWKPNSENKEFWEEVLTNRKIESVGFVNGRVDSLKLDSGETVYITPPQVIYIKEET